MSDETLLVVSGMGVSPYSARGLTQTLEPISAAANLQRTINGELIDLSYDQFRKYKSTITGDDQLPPPLDGIWQGISVTVDCVAELSYKTLGGAPNRTVVATRTEGDFTLYRPRLTMRIVDFQMSTDEYGAQVSWALSLEEI